MKYTTYLLIIIFLFSCRCVFSGFEVELVDHTIISKNNTSASFYNTSNKVVETHQIKYTLSYKDTSNENYNEGLIIEINTTDTNNNINIDSVNLQIRKESKSNNMLLFENFHNIEHNLNFTKSDYNLHGTSNKAIIIKGLIFPINFNETYFSIDLNIDEKLIELRDC